MIFVSLFTKIRTPLKEIKEYNNPFALFDIEEFKLSELISSSEKLNLFSIV